MFTVRNCLIAIRILFFSLQFVKSINVPDIPCPETFKYLNYGDNYIGSVTIKVPLQNTVVDVEFSQREPITTNFNGKLSITPDLKTAQANLENGKPLSYRVDFPNSHILPKLTAIKVNGNTICSSVGYDAPSTTFKVQHSFFPAMSTTFSRPITSNLDNNDIRYTYNLIPTIHNVNTPSPIQHKQDPVDFSFDNPFFEKFFSSQPTSVFEIPLPISNTGTARPPQKAFIPAVAPKMNVPPPSPPKPKPSPDVGCGREGLTPFVVGGSEFPRGKFPWLAAIYLRISADLRFRCGGSLISSRSVITAAHCFPSSTISANLISVNLGRHNLFISEEGSQLRDISSLTIHPNYNISAISDADIALLHLNTPVSFNQYIRPICLWAQSSDLSLVENNKAYVAGWGADNKGNSVSSIAKMVEAKIVGESECLRSSDIFRILTSSRSLCAGNRDGTGPCIGDSGGGLMLNVFGVWTLRGIVSIGPTIQSTCDLREYVVYCDVAKHISWIRQNMLS